VCSQLYVHGAPGCTHNETYETAVSSLGYRLSGRVTWHWRLVERRTPRVRDDLGNKKTPKKVRFFIHQGVICTPKKGVLSRTVTILALVSLYSTHCGLYGAWDAVMPVQVSTSRAQP
jgi:hypothetical protein